jgi:hypothetical protein
MAKVSRRRTIAVPVEEVWRLVSDPHNLPRWWPRTARVENVDRRDGGRRSQWTQVLETAEHLKHSEVAVRMRPSGTGTEVELSSTQTTRGLSRLGSPMLRKGQAGTLDAALDGLEAALS